jgi:hypothetical protein
MSRILVGSRYFFSCYEDFRPHDKDEIEIVETNKFLHSSQKRKGGNCYIQIRKWETTDQYIRCAIRSKKGIVVGKFLVPKFCEAIGMTIEDLPKLQPLIDKLDPLHQYEKIIYEGYIENNSFTLTDEQRLTAYESYKQIRKEKELCR